MKLKDNLVLRKVVGENLIVPTGDLVQYIPMIQISNSAAYLWQFMQEEFTIDMLVERIMEKYTNVTKEIAEKDIVAFVKLLEKHHMIDDGSLEPIYGSVSIKGNQK